MTTRTLPELPPALAGWQWGAAGTDVVLTHPEGLHTTKRYAQPGRAIADAVLWLKAQPSPPAPPALVADVRAQTVESYAAELVPLSLLDDNPYQPRLSYDEAALAEMAAAIKAEGLLQPPIGRRMPDGRVQLAFGHRRRRGFDRLAAEDAQRWGQMPVMIRALDDQAMARQAWKENRDRRDITSYEEARAIERYTTAFGWSQQRAADELGLDRSTVANKLRLLKLPQAALDRLQAGELSERQAAALLPLMELDGAALACQISIWTGTNGTIQNANDLIARAEEFDSAALRRYVDEILDKLAPVISREPWYSSSWDGLAGVHAASCKACPIIVKGARCPDQECARRKVVAWRQQQAAAAAATVGMPAKGAPRGGYDTLGGVSLPALKKEAAARGCGNLGVVYDKAAYFYIPVQGHPNCGVVCAYGSAGRCACKAALDQGKDPEASTKAREKADKQQIRERFKAPAEQALAAALAAPTPGLWRVLLERLATYGELQKLGDAPDLAAIHQALAQNLVKEVIKYDLEYGVNLQRAERHLAQLLTSAGIPLPWQASPAAVVREHLGQARELAGHPMAHHCLGEARKAFADVVASEPIAEAAQLQREIDAAAAHIAQVEAQAATPAPVEAPRTIGMHTTIGWDGVPFARHEPVETSHIGLREIHANLDTIEAAWASGHMAASHVDDLERITEALDELAEKLSDREYEVTIARIGALQARLDEQGVPQ